MTDIVVWDTETTGTDPETDRICEAAWVLAEGTGGRSGSSLLNPERSIPPEASGVHHIVDEDVLDKPTAARWLSDQCLGLEERPETLMVAHNARFDRAFLERACAALRGRRWICTYRCAMHLWPEAPSHKNQALRYFLGLRPELPRDLAPHRALYDALVTEAILRRMLMDHSADRLLELTEQPVLLTTIRFGKYAGQRWDQLPLDYLSWIARKSGMTDEDVVHTARHYLGRRA